MEECAGQMEETLPAGLRREHALAAAEFACRNIHFPRDEETLELARRRLIFEELFCLACSMALLRTRRERAEGVRFSIPPAEEFLALLPFALTAAQRRAMEEVAADAASGAPMNRLVQGDVGSVSYTHLIAIFVPGGEQGEYQKGGGAGEQVLVRLFHGKPPYTQNTSAI